ncbi:MAG: hypothetical protein V1793_08820 [Pseudomonadota bacterium]
MSSVDKYSRPGMDTDIAVSLDEFSRNRYCLAVEDSPAMADYLSNTMKVPVALMDRPWNRDFQTRQACLRHRSWTSIRAALSPHP